MGRTCELTSALGPTDVQEWKGEWTFEGRLKVDLTDPAVSQLLLGRTAQSGVSY